jgi:hypothetical protein
VSKGKDEIVLLTRTVLDVLVELSFNVQVPAEHETDVRVGPALPAGIQVLTGLRVSNGKDRPSDALRGVREQRSLIVKVCRRWRARGRRAVSAIDATVFLGASSRRAIAPRMSFAS